MPARLAFLAGVSTLVVQAGCATKLNFDSVSTRWGVEAGVDASDVDAAESDAGEADSGDWRDASTTGEDASNPPPGQGQDAALLDAGQDTRADASLTDGGQAQADAATGPVADAAPDRSSFACSKLTPAPYICDEFESSVSLNKWEYRIDPPDSAGRASIDSRSARAGRSALLTVVNPDQPGCAQCYLSVSARNPLPELVGRVRLTIEFDMQVENFDTEVGHRIAVLYLFFGDVARGISEHTLELESRGHSLQAQFIEYDYKGSDSADPQPNPPPKDYELVQGPAWNEWVHVKYALDVHDANGSANRLTLTMGDRLLVDDTLQFGLRDPRSTLALGVPLVYVNNFVRGETTNQGWEVRVDSVVVRIEPR